MSFEVDEGEVFGLLGHNGAGKTTLLRLVTGLLRPDSGRVTTFGRAPISEGHEVRRRTGVLTTYPGLDEYLSPAENLGVYGAIHGLAPSLVHERTVQLLDRLGIDPGSRAPARGLSAGLKQRVALARALIHDPELLLLDEPTANLDPIAARDVRDLIREMTGFGRTVVFSTHNLAEAESLCDRIAILHEGHLLAVGSLADLARERFPYGLALVVGPQDAARAVPLVEACVNGRSSIVEDRGQIRITNLPPEDVPDVISALVRSNVTIHEAVKVTPSLEDVYMALHQPAGVP